MFKEYAVVYQNIHNKQVRMYVAYAKSESVVRGEFAELNCYGNCRILSVTEIPE